MEESTALRKSDAVLPAWLIDTASISSVRRDLFCDKSKCWSGAQWFAVNCSLESVLFYSSKIPYHTYRLDTTSMSPGSLRTHLKGDVCTAPWRGPCNGSEVPQKR